MKLGVALVAALSLSECLDPTEIRVVVSTDVPCSSVNGTAIAIGKPGDDSSGVGAKTSACSDDGGIGTLVVTPSGAIDDDVGIRVTLGVGATRADQCVAPKFDGCIVARRSLEYYPHHPLTLPIAMQQICENQFCDPSSTCVNGSCVDAGPTCDELGSCTIDAGPPADAGGCSDIAPKLVAAVKAPVTPHLVQTSTGYAVGWETASIGDPTRAYQVVVLDAQGNAGAVLPMAQTLAAGTTVGPLGTDGTNFAATFETTTSSYTLRIISPSGVVLHEGSDQGTVQLPRAGMRWDPAGAFVFFFMNPSDTPTFEVWTTPSMQHIGVGVGVIGMNDAALAYFNGVHYGSYHDSASCYLATAQVSLSSGTITNTSTWPSCTTLRVAENGPGDTVAFTREIASQGGTTYSLVARSGLSPTASSKVIDVAVDDQAIVALPGVGKQLRVVFEGAESVRELTIDTSLTVTPPKTIASATGFAAPIPGSTGFDAIAEPSSMIHDVVFWASTPTPGIYFTRICN